MRFCLPSLLPVRFPRNTFRILLDFLLIWYDKGAGIIKLVRMGSHSELFSK